MPRDNPPRDHKSPRPGRAGRACMRVGGGVAVDASVERGGEHALAARARAALPPAGACAAASPLAACARLRAAWQASVLRHQEAMLKSRHVRPSPLLFE
eukprot:1295762-Prymnesium_polylepis.3